MPDMKVNSYRPQEYFLPEEKEDGKTNTVPYVPPPERPHPGHGHDDIPPQETPSVEEAQPSKFSSIKAIFKKIWSLFTPDATKDDTQIEEAKIIDQSIQVIGSRPVLQKPEFNSNKGAEALFAALKKKAGAEELVTKVNDVEANDKVETDKPKEKISFGNIDDAALEKATMEIHKQQLNIREKASVTDSQSIVELGKEKKRLWTQYLDLKDEAQRKAKQSKIFGWLSFGSGLIGGALFLGGLVATILTGGAALPGAIAVAGGIAALSGGGTQIGSSVLGFQSNVKTGESIGVKEEVNFKKDEIMAKLQDLETNDNSVTQLWSNIGQILRNMPTNLFR